MRVLVTGDRKWSDFDLIHFTLGGLGMGTIIIEGECEGADLIARRAAECMGYEVIPFPAKWVEHGRAAGPIRNAQMLREGKPDLVLAFHDNIFRSKGTQNMVLQALDAGVKVQLVRHPTKRRSKHAHDIRGL